MFTGNMVEVFKTNVRLKKEAALLLSLLQQQFPDHRINFDLDDCDRILRVEAGSVEPASVIAVLEENGFDCTVLE